MLIALERHLRDRISELDGYWVAKNSQYEWGLARALAMDARPGRYWDALWGEERVEFKKGRSVWLDLVRYSEQLAGISEEARVPVLTLFFLPDNGKTVIDEIIAVSTTALVTELGLTSEIAHQLITLRESVPRSLNVQASLTPRDLRRISEFVVER